MFTSIMTILHHNPEYELIFFTDDDIDRYVCQNYPNMAPHFSMLRAGASRVDVWRMMVIKQYGGVYLDVDMSSIGHFPIRDHDAAVSGVGCWSHLPGHGGLLEHWALAFQPNHPLIRTTLEILEDNLRHPTNPEVDSINATTAEGSHTIRFTGPGPYQRALHRLLRQAECQVVDDNFCSALRDPRSHCNFTAFHALFGNIVITEHLDLNNTIIPKIFYNEHEWGVLETKHYDDVKMRPFERAQSNFCLEEGLDTRKAARMGVWEKKVKQGQS
jgi:hypothetical protein